MKIFSFIRRHWIISGVTVLVVLLIVGGIVSRRNKAGAGVLTDTVKSENLKQTVLATGQVTSTTDLNLSFKASGVVQRVNVKVGDKAGSGQILAQLSQGDQAAILTQARGALAAAQANYQKVLAGASSEEVTVAQRSVDAAQVTLDNAKKSLTDTQAQQDILVTNAYTIMLNSGLQAEASPTNASNSGSAAVTISGSYNASVTGQYLITITGTGGSPQFSYSGLEKGGGTFLAGVPVSLGTRGLFIQFSSTSVVIGDSWTVNIPNTKASNYQTNLNAYNAALETKKVALSTAQNSVNSAQAALDQANASLALKKSQARPADLAAAQAQITSAEGQVQAASSALENTIIRAPANGTITSVDIKVGEQANALKEVIILQDVENLHVEANVSEANIAQVKQGQSVSYTFDALGPDRTFIGSVQTIDPASTVVSGVVNYKVTASVDKLPEIKPGMTANMTILAGSKDNVLAIAERAVLSHDGKKFVRVIDNEKKKTYHEVEVTTGMEADGGLVEITSGLSSGQTIVTFINSK